jgi:hypothetical protein
MLLEPGEVPTSSLHVVTGAPFEVHEKVTLEPESTVPGVGLESSGMKVAAVYW